MQTSVRRGHESDTQSIACHNSTAERETLCVYHVNEQFTVSHPKSEGFEMYKVTFICGLGRTICALFGNISNHLRQKHRFSIQKSEISDPHHHRSSCS